MAAHSVTRQALRTSFRRSSLQTQSRTYSRLRPSIARDHLRTPSLYFTLPAPRLFQSSAQNAAVKLPDSGKSPEPEAHEEPPTQKTEIAIEEYHLRADEFLEKLVSKLEQRQEAKGDIDVEYSVRFNLLVESVLSETD
jgi:frataxin